MKQLNKILIALILSLGLCGFSHSGTAQFKTVSVFGSASQNLSRNMSGKATELGKLMAQKNITVYSTGNTTGLIGSLLQGVSTAKGKSVIVSTPDLYEYDCPQQHICRQSEQMLSETQTDVQQRLYEAGDILIFMPGAWETLNDFTTYAALVEQNAIQKKPVIFLSLNHYWDNLRFLAEEMKIRKAITDDNYQYMALIDKPKDVFNTAQKIQKTIQKQELIGERKQIVLPAKDGDITVHY